MWSPIFVLVTNSTSKVSIKQILDFVAQISSIFTQSYFNADTAKGIRFVFAWTPMRRHFIQVEFTQFFLQKKWLLKEVMSQALNFNCSKHFHTDRQDNNKIMRKKWFKRYNVVCAVRQKCIFLWKFETKITKNGGWYDKTEFIFVISAPEISKNTSLLF